MKSLLSRSLALLLLLICPLSLTARAGTPEAAGELSFFTPLEGYPYGEQPYLYRSPFQMRHSLRGQEGWSSTGTADLYQLTRVRDLDQGGSGAWASLGAYSADVTAGARAGTSYRPAALESVYPPETAGRLRAVLLRGFPRIRDLNAITLGANAWLEEAGKPLIQDLQLGEAILATQQAVWQLVHGDSYCLENGYIGCGSYDGTGAVLQDNAGEGESAYTAGNIRSLREYLLALPPAQGESLTAQALENLRYGVARESDGSFTLTLWLTVNAPIREGDALTLRAWCGARCQSVPLTSPGDFRFVLRNLPEQGELILELSGTRAGGDVFVFQPDGAGALPLVGWEEGGVPVLVQRNIRILNPQKPRPRPG